MKASAQVKVAHTISLVPGDSKCTSWSLWIGDLYRYGQPLDVALDELRRVWVPPPRSRCFHLWVRTQPAHKFGKALRATTRKAEALTYCTDMGLVAVPDLLETIEIHARML
jgi:hypothetical protein